MGVVVGVRQKISKQIYIYMMSDGIKSSGKNTDKGRRLGSAGRECVLSCGVVSEGLTSEQRPEERNKLHPEELSRQATASAEAMKEEPS